jgi:hypothetical protein
MILITGASSGIGEATARKLARSGVELFLVARRTDRLEKLAKDLRDRGAEVHFARLDVSSRDAVDRFVRAHRSRLRRVDGLINNAGLARGLSSIQQARVEDLEEMIATNLSGLIYITKALLPMLIKNQGHIVNLGSVAGRWVYPKGHVYCATKSAVRALNEALRMDLSGSGVRVTEIAPGMVETEFSEVRMRSRLKAKAVYQGMTPLVADDIAECIAWCLARPQHVNIQELVVYPTDQASPTIVHRSRDQVRSKRR